MRGTTNARDRARSASCYYRAPHGPPGGAAMDRDGGTGLINEKNKIGWLVAIVFGVIGSGATMGTAAFADDEVANFAAQLNVEYERPGVDFEDYDKLIINDLDVDNTKIVPPPWTEGQTFNWEISDRNVAALQKEFHASMTEQISGSGGYEIVTEPDDGTMELTLTIVSFMPYAERKEKVITKGSGEMQISVQVRDAKTGVLLGIYEGPQEVGKDYDENTDFAREQNLKKLFDSWGRRVRIAMDEDRQ